MSSYLRQLRSSRWAFFALGVLFLATVASAQSFVPFRGPPLGTRPGSSSVVPPGSPSGTLPIIIPAHVALMPNKPNIGPLNNGSLLPDFVFNICETCQSSGGLGGGGIGGGGLSGGLGGGGFGGGGLAGLGGGGLGGFGGGGLGGLGGGGLGGFGGGGLGGFGGGGLGGFGGGIGGIGFHLNPPGGGFSGFGGAGVGGALGL